MAFKLRDDIYTYVNVEMFETSQVEDHHGIFKKNPKDRQGDVAFLLTREIEGRKIAS